MALSFATTGLLVGLDIYCDQAMIDPMSVDRADARQYMPIAQHEGE
jgi:hypothetical protein